MNIRIRLYPIAMFFLVYSAISFSSCAQENSINTSDESSYSLRELSSIKFTSPQSDTTELTREQLMSKYEDEKIDPSTAMLLNFLTGPFVVGHYYINKGSAALKYHIAWGLGIGAGVLAVNNNSDTWAYICAGLIAYAWAYSPFEAQELAKQYNMNWRKTHGLTNVNKNSIPYHKLLVFGIRL